MLTRKCLQEAIVLSQIYDKNNPKIESNYTFHLQVTNDK